MKSNTKTIDSKAARKIFPAAFGGIAVGILWILVSSSGCSLTSTEVLFQYPDVGFTLKLPDSWQGYRVESIYWEGLKNDPDTGDVVVETGPLIIIHHPASTLDNPRQEIPVMILTIQQWEALLAQEWNIGAAPVAPLEIGRNSQYVFALPARYNYAFPEGWEEVEQILSSPSIIVNEPE